MHDHSRFLKGTLYMTLSGFALSFMMLFSRLLLGDLAIIEILFLRFLIPTIILFPIVLYLERENFSEVFSLKKENFLKFLRSLFAVAAQFFILYYLTKGTLLNATVLLNTGPLFIPILERIFLGLKIGKSTAVAMLVSAFGVILILHPNRSLFETTSLIGILAGVCQAASQVLFGRYAEAEKGVTPLFYFFFVATLIILPFAAFFFEQRPREFALHFTTLAWVYVMLLSITSILNQYYRGKAYFHGKPSTLACFLYVSIVFSALLDWIVFKQQPQIHTYIGAALVIIGGILKIYLRYLILKRRGL